MASVSACGADFMKSKFRLGIVVEHAASMKPHATTAMSRLMIPPHSQRGAGDPAQLKPFPRTLWLPLFLPKWGCRAHVIGPPAGLRWTSACPKNYLTAEGTPTARSDSVVGLELKWMHLAPMVGRNADDGISRRISN